MSSLNRPVTRHVYAVVLRKDTPSPVADTSGDASAGRRNHHAAAQKPPKVKIDFLGIEKRIVPLPISPRLITALAAGRNEKLFFTAAKRPLFTIGVDVGIAGPQTLYEFDLKTQKTRKLATGVTSFRMADDGVHILYAKSDKGSECWFIAKADALPKKHGLKLDTESMRVWVNPREEWETVYREAWRVMDEFFYDPNLHGLDAERTEKLYWPYVKNLVSERGLYYILNNMRAWFDASHMFRKDFVGRQELLGNLHRQPASVGLLGADYVVQHGRYRIERIYGPGPWHPNLHAPLAQPGLDVHVGDYLLAVNGRKLTAQDNLYFRFKGTAGKKTSLKVGPNPDGTGAHSIVVTPVRSTGELRQVAWVQHNLRTVNRLSDGKIAYVYLPNTAEAGLKNFNRYFFSQLDKKAVIIDERFNGGGLWSDYIIDYLRRRLLNYTYTRAGHVKKQPKGAIYGPMVMLINNFSGSGGDMLPWYFKQMHLGLLIGTRTYGGVNGVADAPTLIDGTVVSTPSEASYGPTGQWVIENVGVSPTIKVPFSPKAWRNGRDSQLDKAVQVLLQELKNHPPKTVKPPPMPNYHQRPKVSPPASSGIGNSPSR